MVSNERSDQSSVFLSINGLSNRQVMRVSARGIVYYNAIVYVGVILLCHSFAIKI